MNRRLESAAARIRHSEDEPVGDLKVTTTLAFGTLWLAPRLPKLYEKYPDLRIDLILEERVLDLPMREADVAIRMKEPSQADLIRRKLDVLQRHCEEAGRDYEEIERTSLGTVHLAPGEMGLDDVIGACRELAGAGIQHAIFNMPNVHDIEPLETFGREIIPAVADL